MCGIVGIVSSNSQVDLNMAIKMRDTLRHRGPDDAGEWLAQDRNVCLAHSRLSIIDLSATGHQPMLDRLKQFVIVFNGEIYNYKDLKLELEGTGHIFYTRSDTEVILEAYKAWGDECVKHLNGMFAFCIYDIKRQRIFAARDRAGEKPFFYSYANGKFIFASELKALMAYPELNRRINPTALKFYFTYGYIPGEHCILDGVKKLPPASVLTFEIRSGNLKVWTYWSLPDSQHSESQSIEELADELSSLLLDSVRRQLFADVPVAILLSGGMDSSLITAMAARVSSKRIKTFTVVFPDNIKFNESSHAKLIAKFFATDHTELVAEPVNSKLLLSLARQYDEPICDSSMIPTYLVSKLISQNTKVALGGDGGDELFGGYLRYNWLFWQDLFIKSLPLAFRKSVVSFIAYHLPAGIKGRNFLLGLRSDIVSSISQANVLFDEYLLNRLIKHCSDESIKSVKRYKTNLYDLNRGLPGAAMALDFKTYLPEDILAKVDRASMLNSLEIRAPFLDQRIIEFAFKKVPNRLRANIKERKILLKYIAKRILPSAFDSNRKQGFSVPIGAWFKGELGRTAKEILLDNDSELFDKKQIQSLIINQQKGYSNGERLFALTLFELWRREYNVVI